MTKLGFIGAGQMARALATGIAKSQPGDHTFHLHDPNLDTVEALAETLSPAGDAVVQPDNQSVIDHSEVVFLAVKPQVLEDALDGIRVDENVLVVSIVAGKDLFTLQRLTGTERIIRVMPNTPCLIGQGASGLARGTATSDKDVDLVLNFLRSVGVAVEVRPDLIDAVTGVSGSGPAYVYTFIEALIDGGVMAGLYREDARELAIQTVIGAAQLVKDSGLHPAQLRDQVTSPGGTTMAAMKMLEETGFRDAVMSAVIAARDRAEELG